MTPEKSNPVLAGLYAGVCVGLGLFLIAASPSPTNKGVNKGVRQRFVILILT